MFIVKELYTIINNIFNAIREQIDTLHDNELQQEIKKALEYLEIIHQQEDAAKINETEDTDKLLTTINSL